MLGAKLGRKTEEIYHIGEDAHSLCIGATRSGKSRCIALPSIGLLGLAGESMILSDPKAELYTYTYPYLQRLGYEVRALDFRTPAKSDRWNFLQRVIDAARDGDAPQAIDAAWDVTNALVKESKSEPIWHNGEASVIAGSILAVVFENIDRPEYQNLANVYMFIAEMCRSGAEENGEILLNRFTRGLAPDHPARALFGIADVAPGRTRASFFTSALTTLRLFTNPMIHAMTRESDIRLDRIGQEKTALFIILPDERTTYYSLASLFVHQVYEALVKDADAKGGRLRRRVNLILDEVGNFSTIPAFATKLTVGAGRGIRFNLFVQGLSQLDEKYGRENAKTIVGNCLYWLYLQSEDMETLKAISEKLGRYTVSSSSESSSYTARGGEGSSSQSRTLMGRPLLTPDEVRMLERPYTLVISREYPAMMYTPDLSAYAFNRLFGLGDPAQNQLLREVREAQRNQRPVESHIRYWGIWDAYRESAQAERPQGGRMNVYNELVRGLDDR